MAVAGVLIRHADDQRTSLARTLEKHRAAIGYEVRRRTAGTAESSLGLRLLTDEVTTLVIEAIERDFWDDFFDWVDARRHFLADSALSKRVIVLIARLVEAIAERTLDGFSTLLGELRVRVEQIRRIIYRKSHLSWRAYEEVMHDPIDVAVDDVIRSLDTKDMSTGEHSRAVSAWCTRLAMKLGLSDAMILKVTRGGMVHDLGKTTTPLEILQAPRKLSDEEWKIMSHHVVAGWEMLKRIPALGGFDSIVRHHHERYTGGGYPDNLDREDIPLTTRIVSVADSFNAMIGRRPYRRPLSPMTAIEELRRHRGTQFDPDVTDAMAEVVYDLERHKGTDVPATRVWARPTLIETGL